MIDSYVQRVARVLLRDTPKKVKEEQENKEAPKQQLRGL